jgi:uncharacterized protein YegJ (DUF2314 family)
MKRIILCLMLISSFWSSGAQAQRDELQDRPDIEEVADSDPAMNAAIAEAKRTLPEFLAILRPNAPKSSEITFKYPLGGWEHIWVEKVKIDGPYLTGRLANMPAQDRHKMGDAVRVPLNEVSDWGYRNINGVMQGHFTTRVLLPRIQPNVATSIRQSFGWK